MLTILISEKISMHTLVRKLQPLRLPQSPQPQHHRRLVSSALVSHSLQ